MIFLYRPEYYDILEDENGNDNRGIAEIIIAKHRNGELKTVKTKFINRYAKFVNLEDNDFSFQPTDIRQPSAEPTPSGNYKILKSRMDDSDDSMPF